MPAMIKKHKFVHVAKHCAMNVYRGRWSRAPNLILNVDER
jgi:hypothetical protein